MYLLYSFKLAMQSVWREKWINLLSMLTIGAGLFMIALAFLTAYNTAIATKKLPEKFSMMLYLSEGISEQEAENIVAGLKKNSAIERVRYISKVEALEELKGVLKQAAYVLEGIDENPLSASIEIKLNPKFMDSANIKILTADVKKIKGVEDVEYGEQFLNAIHTIKTGAQALSLLIIGVMSAGVIFVCYSTVKIMFYRRKEEIETFKLLGATKGFIRAPFVIEGGILGVGGGILGAAAMFALYYALFYKLVLIIPVFKIIVFPSEIFAALPLVGLALGINGAIISIGRIRFY